MADTMGKTRAPGVVQRLLAFPETNIFLALLVMVVAFRCLAPEFLSDANVFSVLKTLSFYGIVAVGETLVMIGGDIDISVGSTAGLGAVLSTYLMMESDCLGMLGTNLEWVGVLLCMVATLAVCSLVGLVNAVLVVKLRIPAFIATISTLYSVRGMIMVVTKGNPIYPLPPFFVDFFGGYEWKVTEIGGISLPFMLFIALAAVFEFVLRKIKFGRNLYATGSNRDVAELSGINTNRIRFANYIVTAMLAALAGMLVAAFTKQGYPPIGLGWELWIVAATVIGGIGLKGGVGSVIGAVLGMFIMNVLNNGLVMLKINTFIQQSILGVIILAAVYLDIRRRNRKVSS